MSPGAADEFTAADGPVRHMIGNSPVRDDPNARQTCPKLANAFSTDPHR